MGRSTDRCEDCGKRIYRTRKLAATVAAKVRRKNTETVGYYKCPSGHWHIGHPNSAERWAETTARRVCSAGRRQAG